MQKTADRAIHVKLPVTSRETVMTMIPSVIAKAISSVLSDTPSWFAIGFESGRGST